MGVDTSGGEETPDTLAVVRQLEKWQWNAIIEAIEEAGLDPKDPTCTTTATRPESAHAGRRAYSCSAAASLAATT